MIIKKEGIIEFGKWLTGHDTETVEKLFDDFNNYKERNESVLLDALVTKSRSSGGAIADKLSRQIEVINMQNNIKSMNKQILGVLNRGKLDDDYKNVLELFTQLTEQYAKLTEILAEMLIEHKLL